jgi:hypothetical protein
MSFHPSTAAGLLPLYARSTYRRLSRRKPGTGGSTSARYCYSIWLRHLILASRGGLPTTPRVVAELGPGDSLGVGLAALLTGSAEYYAMDSVAYSNVERNLIVFEEIASLLAQRAALPGDDEFPDVKPRLDSYAFPSDVLDAARLEAALAPDRREAIRRAIAEPDARGPIRIQYFAPWMDVELGRRESVDALVSQAVLEHVDDVPRTYEAMHSWLRPGGWMSHQVDLRSHGTAPAWNGHWAYPERIWRSLVRPHMVITINRQPCSVHLAHAAAGGAALGTVIHVPGTNGIGRDRLSREWAALSDDDLDCQGVFFQSVKPR